jgi:hypothetical protein
MGLSDALNPNQAKQLVQAPSTTRAPEAAVTQERAARVAHTPLDDLDKSLIHARDRVARDANAVRALADRLFGGEPEGDAGGNTPLRSGRLGSLNDSADFLHVAISELEHQLDRLAPLVGG